MTPERIRYLIKMSKRESYIRLLISERKHQISKYKFVLNNNETCNEERQRFLLLIREYKFRTSVLRHELQRIKGMDRVVRVKNTYLDCYGSDCFECKCGHEVEVGYYEHCPWCGRKILRERVRK